jgi:hypothetical protein
VQDRTSVSVAPNFASMDYQPDPGVFDFAYVSHSS